jgi:pimeloyl-ACP methyl ester carboxylesterase
MAALVLTALAMSFCSHAFSAGPVVEISQDDWVAAKKEATLPTGVTLKYVEMGQPGGQPLVLIHGMTDNSRSWSLIAPFLASSHRLIIPDLRGHGGSGKPDTRMYTVSLHADDIAALMDALNIGKAHVLGHSLGSMVAQALAINYPEKVNKVVLESSALVTFESLGKGIYEAAVGFGENPPDDAFMAEWYSNPNPVDQDFLKREMAESQAIPPSAWKAIAKGSSASDLSNFMDELKAPVLVLWGSADGFFGAEAQKALKEAIPQAESVDYDNIGHNIQWEIPERMAKDVLGFLAK